FLYCLEVARKQGIVLDPETDSKDMAMLDFASEDAKKELSTQGRTFLTCVLAGKSFELEISQETFEGLTQVPSDSILELVQQSLERAELSCDDIDSVVFVGGGSRSPFACKQVEALFKPEQIKRDIDPEHAVVLGGCESIGMKIQEKIAAGDEELRGEMDGHEIPGVTQLEEITAKAFGVRAFSRSLQKEVLAEVVPQGSPVSMEYTRCFSLQNGDQDDVSASIVILEGNNGCDVCDAKMLAEFPLDGLPAGAVKDRILIQFFIDGDNLIHVEATDTESGKSIKEVVDPNAA
ncbi:Hsp70 family protein, partial [bacterium AH-315-P07]|nr:Hsp70 family protein [bacterium AH-315-P07]